MKKTLFTIISILAVSAATAGTIINHSNRASPTTALAKSFEAAVGASDFDFFQAGNCVEAQQRFNRTDNAIMIFNADVGIAALSRNLNCPFDAAPSQTFFIGKSYLKVCTSSRNPKTMTEARTIGAASVILSPGLIKDYNSNGLNLRGIPYGGSRDVLGAVIAGDIDLGFIGAGVAAPAIADGRIVCELDTDPRSTNFVGNKYQLKIPTLPILKVFYTNSQDPAFIARLRNSVKSNDFHQYITKSGYNDVKIDNITADDIKQVQEFINDSYRHYWR